MKIFIILGVIIMIVAIAMLTRGTTDKKESRKVFLEKFANFLEGRITRLENYQNSYKVTFEFEARKFIFEDIDDHLMKARINRGFLKIATNTNLIMSFTEKSRTKVRFNTGKISELTTGKAQKLQLLLPKSLEEFDLYTNDPKMTAKLLDDPDFVYFFKSFKNQDDRGHPVMSLEILDGMVTLRYHPPGVEMNPNLQTLHHNVTAIETYLDQMIELVDLVNNTYEREKDNA